MAARSTGLDTAGDFEVLGERFGRAGRLEPLAAIDAIAAGVSAVAVRDAIGPDRDLTLDFHGRFSEAMSRRALPFLEPLLALSVEEPVLPESSWDLGAVVRSISISIPIPIATGERLCSRWDFRSVLSDGIAVTRPDISHAGGISGPHRIAAMAEPYDVLVAPHCPLGPIALAATSKSPTRLRHPRLPHSGTGLGHRLRRQQRPARLPRRHHRTLHVPRRVRRPRQRPASASPSTRTWVAPPPNTATAGAIRSGATSGAHWQPGSRPARSKAAEERGRTLAGWRGVSRSGNPGCGRRPAWAAPGAGSDLRRVRRRVPSRS
ncbi:enolase C-terminal domain-like protein [Streptomyces griseorubiginosus]|uniref:enolase C-terminal domain-like protein n=1 Tax=Streptomyces TaxID=1883 RepID=UPI0036A634B4